MKYFFILLVLSIAHISCSPKQIAGIYEWRISDNSIIIHLDSFNRFSFKARYGMSSRITAGQWIISDNKVFLTSDSNYTSTYGIVKEQFIQNRIGYQIQFFDFACNEPENELEVIINGRSRMKPDSSGRIIVQIPINTIQVKSESFNYFYYVKNSSSNDFSVCVYIGMSNEIFLYQEPFRLRNGAIVMADGVVLVKEK